MTKISQIHRFQVKAKKIIAQRINTANHFIFEGKSLLPKPQLDGEATLTRIRIIKKMERMENPIYNAIQKDLYERFHNPYYRS